MPQDIKTLGSRTVCQIGIVVRDIEAASRAYAGLLDTDVPQWHLTGSQEETRATYRGAPTDARAKLAFFQMDNLSIELIEPVGGPSTWREFLDAHGEGVHHIAFRIKDTDAHAAMLARRGMPVVHCGEYKGGRYTYIDSAAQLKVILELLENL